MFIGHFAVGLLGKRVARTVPLGTLLLAAALPDVLWCAFLVVGVEHVAISPGITAVNALDLFDIGLSHSLVMDFVWAGALMAGYWSWRRDRRGLWVIFAAVLSHWVLDFVSHRPDMPLAPGVERYFGLGLWNSPWATFLVEGSLWLLSIVVYVRATRSARGGVSWGFWIGIVLLTALWVVSLGGQAPPSVLAVVVVNSVLLLLVLGWAYWVERSRAPRS